MGTTSDRNDPDLTHGIDETPVNQAKRYLISDGDLSKGYIRPLRFSYIHTSCGETTIMAQSIAATYAKNPSFYGATYCTHCRMHRPVGEDGEFVWSDGGEKVGT
jgi:hypothetical protein